MKIKFQKTKRSSKEINNTSIKHNLIEPSEKIL